MKLGIPENIKLGTEKKMTDAMIVKGRQLLKEGHSQRFVANELGVSRHTVLMHCKRGYKQWFRNRFKNYDYVKQNPNEMEARRTVALRRYRLFSDLFPKEMKEQRKKSRTRMGKKYFRDYMKKYRNDHLKKGKK